MSAQFSVKGSSVKGESHRQRWYNDRMPTLLLRQFVATLLFLQCALLWNQGVQAEIVDDIYTARLVVEGRDTRSLNAARRAGLAEVLIKASGDPQAPQSAEVLKALDSSQTYLLGYSYEEEADGTVLLRMEYDEQAVQQLLREAGLRLWTANRPLVLTWLVISDEQGRRFASVDAAPQADSVLRESFVRRGVPLQTPLYDLMDTAAISPGEAWRQSSPALMEASSRYRGAEVLAGRVARLSDGSWVGDWRYLDNGRWRSRSSVADSLQAFTDAGAELVAGTLVEQYGVKLTEDSDERYRLTLRGVRSFDDYMVLQQVLGSLEAVRSVVPESLLGDQVSLRVKAETDLQQLARIIELDTRFVPLPLEPGQNGLSYEWIR
ncbi:DUF2066 domain-containing protein [Congregibacter variabilis]|uniref:DUF2066 domain-containing protein n=1 Tax=Congregibacter variabilis TaxID=3081200 RepID=A0ABZ0I218_9GAMM|nr:DUF2066 domain-containing protein [Congregibacter sp. IMCC43200]